MQTQIYVLFGLVAAVALCLLYTAITCTEKFKALEWEKDNASAVKDIEDTIRSLMICSRPALSEGHCDACMQKETGDGSCISDLMEHAADLLTAYEGAICDGKA